MNKRGLKKGLFFLLILSIVFCAVYVIADYTTQAVQSVTIDSPGNNIYISSLNGSNQTFKCNVTFAAIPVNQSGEFNLTLWHNINGTMMVNLTNGTAIINNTAFTGFGVTLPEGNWSWMCAAGNFSNVTAGSNYINSSVYTISVDYTSPTITVEAPTNNSWYSSTGSKTFDIHTSDIRTSNVSMSCWYRYTDGNNWSNNISTPCDVTTLFQINNESWNLSIVFYANDSLGNENGSQSYRKYRFGVNTGVPSVILNSPVDGYNFTNTTNNYIDFNCSVSDASGIYSITLMTNATGTWGGNFTDVLVTDHPYGVDATNFVTNVSNIPDGTYLWNCLAGDTNLSGTGTYYNSTASANYTFTVDTMAPAVNEVLLSDYFVQNATNVTVYVNVNDSGTGIHNVTAEGVILTRVDDNNYTGTITLYNYTDALTIDVNASDYMGNVVNYVSQVYSVDMIAPSFTALMNYTDTQLFNLSVNVTYNSNISLNFSETIDINTLTTGAIRLFDTNVSAPIRLEGDFYFNITNATETIGNGSAVNITYAQSTKTFFEMNPYRNMVPGKTYTLLISNKSGAGVADNASNYLVQQVYYYFKIKEDCDRDGILDALDQDDDNDGTPDTSDFLTGNLSHPASNIHLNMSVDWALVSTNVTDVNSVPSVVRFYNYSNVSLPSTAANGSGTWNHSPYIIEFNYTFGPTKEIDLRNVSIYWHNETSYGMVWTYGLYPEPNSTTVYVYNSTNYSTDKNVAGICLKDGNYQSPYNFSSNCTASDELYLHCPSTNIGSSQFAAHKYNCSNHIFNGQQYFKVTGFTGNVLARQMDDTAPPKIVQISASASASNVANWTLLVKTDEVAQCYFSSSDVAIGSMTRFQGNGYNHSYSVVFSAESAGSWYVRCNDTQNNAMSFSNNTAYDYDTTNDTSTSSSATTTTTSTSEQTETASSTIAAIVAGEAAVVEFDGVTLAISSVAITTNEDVNNVKLTVTKQSSRQSGTSSNAPGDVYYYVTIDKTNLDDSQIEESKVDFQVERDWLENNGYDTDDVVLLKYDNGEWVELNTRKVFTSSNYVFYQAKGDGLSYFAISVVTETTSAEEKEEETIAEEIVTEVTTEGMAWWWWIIISVGIAVAITGIVLGIVFLVKKKHKKPFKPKKNNDIF